MSMCVCVCSWVRLLTSVTTTATTTRMTTTTTNQKQYVGGTLLFNWKVRSLNGGRAYEWRTHCLLTVVSFRIKMRQIAVSAVYVNVPDRTSFDHQIVKSFNETGNGSPQKSCDFSLWHHSISLTQINFSSNFSLIVKYFNRYSSK